jgi:hypothetical protein
MQPRAARAEDDRVVVREFVDRRDRHLLVDLCPDRGGAVSGNGLGHALDDDVRAGHAACTFCNGLRHRFDVTVH